MNNPILLSQITKYQNIALKFINTHKKDLFRIYLQHLKTDGNGVLAINLTEVEEKNNIDVTYISNKVLPIELINKINERKLVNNENIIYFLIITTFDENIVEIDINTLDI